MFTLRTLLSVLSYTLSPVFSFLCIQPTHTRSKGEENLLIPVHAYPVIDDLCIPPHIDLSAVPLGNRCVRTPYSLCVRIFIGLFPDPPPAPGWPVSSYPSIQLPRLPFAIWCQIITTISHLVCSPPVSSVCQAIPLRCSCPVDFEFQVQVIQPHEAFCIQPLTGRDLSNIYTFSGRCCLTVLSVYRRLKVSLGIKVMHIFADFKTT